MKRWIKRRQLGNTLAIIFAIFMLFAGYSFIFWQLFIGDFVGVDSVDDHILLIGTAIVFSLFAGMFIGFFGYNGDKKAINLGITILIGLISISYGILMIINSIFVIAVLLCLLPFLLFGLMYLGSFIGTKIGLKVWDSADLGFIEKIRKIWLMIRKQEFNLEEIAEYSKLKLNEVEGIIIESLAEAKDGYYMAGGGIYIEVLEGEISKDGLTFIPS